MNTLAFDTSTEYLTVAVVRDGRPACGYHRRAGRNHSRLLVPAISRLIKRAGLRIGKIEALAVGVGPGSFTGLRIGAAVAKGLGYCGNVPIAPVPTFDAIAANFRCAPGVICVVLDARKNKVYGCFYRSDGKKAVRLSKYMLLPAAELLKMSERYDRVLFAGDGAAILGKDGYGSRPWHPRATMIAELGLALLRKNKSVKPGDLEPMYLYSRECDITGA